MKLLVIKLLTAIIFVPSISFSLLNKDGDKEDKKITICHIPPGNPANMHQITISTSALQTHLNHGDIICGNDQ